MNVTKKPAVETDAAEKKLKDQLAEPVSLTFHCFKQTVKEQTKQKRSEPPTRHLITD
jgi:hypothetical protein